MPSSPGVRTTSRGHLARPAEPSQLGPWQLLQLLGAGPWTLVFRARPLAASPDQSGDYVVKTLKPEFSDDPLAVGLLKREAFVAAQVRHVNVAAVLSHHVQAAPHYLVSPYQSGATVHDALQAGGRLGPPHALWIARQAAQGLAVLHRRGWRHADIKPANLFVAASGHVTLLDLGLAQQINRARPSRLCVGSPAYLPPEVLRGRVAVDGQGDVYSLGVTLFEMLTARRPFLAEDPQQLAADHLVQPPPDPRPWAPDLPARVCRLLRRMLAKEPLRRPTAGELVDWLADLEIDTLEQRAAG